MLTNDEIDERIARIPPLTESVRKAIEILNGREEDIDFMLLGRVLSSSPALMARILAVANSPFYGMSGQINTLSQANIVLGIRSLRSIVTAAGLVNQLPPGSAQLIDVAAEWEHGLSTAITAAAIAQLKGVDRELCFTAGLLHDLGVFILALYFKDEYAPVLALINSGECLPQEAERKVLGTDHCVVGEKVARHWSLPKAICRCIREHHGQKSGKAELYIDVVHVADIVSRALSLGASAHYAVDAISPDSLARLGLQLPEIATLFESIENDFEASLALVRCA